MPYEGYARDMYTTIPTDSYLYPVRQLAEFMMSTQNIINLRGSERTQNTSKKNMSN